MADFQRATDLKLGESLSILFDGLKLALSKECRLYIIVPIILNFILLSAISYFLITYVFRQW